MLYEYVEKLLTMAGFTDILTVEKQSKYYLDNTGCIMN